MSLHNGIHQTETNHHESPYPPTTEQERNAMRGFLQRAEVRLSTMHRVAVGFLSGAGLLLLFPVFFKDAILGLIKEFLNYQPILPASAGPSGLIPLVILYLCVMYPFLLSLIVPGLALILLVKDIVRFYFAGHAPGFPDDMFNPRFVLSGVAFSPDESESIKTKVEMAQYGTDLINFVLSHDEKKSSYFGDLIDSERRIVPKSRKLPRLIERGIVAAPEKSLDELGPNDKVRVMGTYHDRMILPTEYKERSVKEIDRFNAALGLAGFLDRPLHEEVAKQEVSLVRHALNLRRLVLRYAQALLIFIWTMTISFAMLPFLQDTKGRFPALLVFGVGYTIWALITPFVVQLPVYWLARLSDQKIRRSAMREFYKNDGLEYFEQSVKISCYFALIASIIAVGISIWLHFV